MILGDICTRACGFCSVNTGKPIKVDTMEPYRTAMAVKKMKLRHVVITSVDRDDLKGDFGASIWAVHRPLAQTWPTEQSEGASQAATEGPQ